MSTTVDRPVSPAPSLHSYGEFLAALLSDRESFFDEVVAGVQLGRKAALCAGYSTAARGTVRRCGWGLQRTASGRRVRGKVAFLFLATFAVCFPAFDVVQVLVGSRLRLLQVVVLVTSALALTAVVLAAFVPVPAFFLLLAPTITSSTSYTSS